MRTVIANIRLFFSLITSVLIGVMIFPINRKVSKTIFDYVNKVTQNHLGRSIKHWKEIEDDFIRETEESLRKIEEAGEG